MKVQIVKAVGMVYTLSVRWFEDDHVCPINSTGHHEAEHEVSQQVWDDPARSDTRYPSQCDHCHREIPNGIKVHRWGRGTTVYDTRNGKLIFGHAYWRTHTPDEHCYWSNCDGRHLMVVMPDGGHWDVMSRASNCDMKDDKLHRCWVLHMNEGVPHVDKNGLTCHAGAGSIQWGPNYHGFLHHGELNAC